MSLDRHAAERRRFARLLGTDGELGCGLPIGEDSGEGSEPRDGTDGDADPRATDDSDSTRPRDGTGGSSAE